ncbi:hypothetical protein [Streptomyces djakartensis]|uniref:Uncharacterized protein n=1 Tax=Streptomyces djakartensis TaxID=68193 RepID=A0ABQ2ZN88_9ACTN|nr:hypothetical protein [Streptomyces djakartensis]GGY20784.1 hypothetical protein GCM10010384_29360 [Streptomyces djakartensis]
MALLAEYSCKAKPARRVVEVYDADAFLSDDDAMEAARRQVVAGNGYHLYILSLQPDIDVEVAIRVWDAPPAPPVEAEGHAPVSIESETGVLVVNQLEYGPAGEMTLPRPGVYEGHTWWEGRKATAEYYDKTLDLLTDDSPAGQLTEAWDNCPVTERYVLDLAYVREPEPVDDDDL